MQLGCKASRSRCYGFMQPANLEASISNISASSNQGSCRLKASFRDKWQDPLLNDQRGKMGVIHHRGRQGPGPGRSQPKPHCLSSSKNGFLRPKTLQSKTHKQYVAHPQKKLGII
eukprot:1142676-Pelagomonas_calceolata.AAC.1